MPCTGGPSGDSWIGDLYVEEGERARQKELLREVIREEKEQLEAASAPLRKSIGKQQQEIDLTTRLLCELLKKNPKLARGNKDLEAWWKKHKILDEIRD